MARSLALLIASLLLAVGGCVAGGDAQAADAGAPRPDADPLAPDARPCGAAPSPAPSWLGGYQDEIVAKLSGAQAIEGGTTLVDRATVGGRATTAAYLEAELANQGFAVELQDYGTGRNLWVELPATDGADTWIVLGAHYDSVSGSPGANDNATGVALVLAVARYLRTVECRRVNVIFVLFDQEEIGLVGSAAFAALLAGDDSRTVLAVHTVDQMGWDADDDRGIELERASAGLFEVYAWAKSSGGFTMPLTETTTGATDHVSFRARGFAAVGLTEQFVSGDTTPHYHASTDTYDTVNLAYLASTTALVNQAFADVVRGEVSTALSVAPRPVALSGRLRSFEPAVDRVLDRDLKGEPKGVLEPGPAQAVHGCRGARAPSSPMMGEVSGKSAAESF